MRSSGTHVWLVMMKAFAAAETIAVRSIETLGMCYSDFKILECLLHKGPLPINTVGAKLHLTSGSITTAVDRLEQRGFVERVASDTDRRSKLVALTKLGKKTITVEFEKHCRDMDALGEALTAKERAQLIELLKKYGQNASAVMSHRD